MKLHLPHGTAGRGPWVTHVLPDRDGWLHTSLRVLELPPGGAHRFTTNEQEVVVLPLSGAALVECDGVRMELTGRASVFAAVSDFAYAPRDAMVSISSSDGGRFAVAGAACDRRLTPRHRAAADVPVELRGAGAASRQVNNFCTPASFEADKLIAVEVLTPGGNWSSYPPHKHDEERPGEETELEEIYYVELSRPGGLAYLRVYGQEDRPIDVLAEVGTGDVVLIPHGWHGPAVTAPGVDMYYLNVMAGPGPERAWRICDDPAHAAVRAEWVGVPIDPRLPLTSA